MSVSMFMCTSMCESAITSGVVGKPLLCSQGEVRAGGEPAAPAVLLMEAVLWASVFI